MGGGGRTFLKIVLVLVPLVTSTHKGIGPGLAVDQLWRPLKEVGILSELCLSAPPTGDSALGG